MSARVRLVGAVIHLDLVVDDGDVLTPLNVDPLRLAAADVPTFDVAAAVAQLQARLDQQQEEDV